MDEPHIGKTFSEINKKVWERPEPSEKTEEVVGQCFNKLALSKKKYKDTKVTTLSSQQRWRIRGSWPTVALVVNSKGFGALATLKDLIGCPKAVKDDHHDVDYDNLPASDSNDLKSGKFLELAMKLDPEHKLSTIFYDHLFTCNPQMTEIFWRFNIWQSMEKIVEVLDPNVDMNVTLKSLAERHRGRGILNEDYDKIGRSFVYVFDKLNADEPKKYPKSTCEAWVAAWHVFSEAMKVNEDEENQEEEAAVQNSGKVYTMAEISGHNTPQSCWLIVHNKVYDLTEYLSIHPGGDMMLLGAGKDATTLFLKNFHSPRAVKLLQKYYIGDVEASAQVKTKETTIEVADAVEGSLSVEHFRNFEIKNITQVTYNTKLYTFGFSDPNMSLAAECCSHVKLRYIEDGQQHVRSYTPVSVMDQKGSFDLLIKTYISGITKYLDGKHIGDKVEIMGTFQSLKYESNKWDQILMIAGGTGITPMLQLLRTIFKKKEDKTQIILAYCNSTHDDVLEKDVLDSFTANHTDRFRLFHIISHLKKEDQINAYPGRMSKEAMEELELSTTPTSKSLVMYCGPPAFNACVASFLPEFGYAKDQIYEF